MLCMTVFLENIYVFKNTMQVCHLKIKCISVEPLGSITRVIVEVVSINRTCWRTKNIWDL